MNLTQLTGMVDPLISLLDDDNNNDIRFGELDTFARKFGRGSDDLTKALFNKIFAVVDAFFDVCDSDQSGGCSIQELFSMVRTVGGPWLPLNKYGEFGTDSLRSMAGSQRAGMLLAKCD
jgi:Ca2+-binding EF-hand superfamily protein